MAKRELTKEERRQAHYDEPYAWHIKGQQPEVYHVAPNCPEGHNLRKYLMADFLCGTGGYSRCSQCDRLGC